MLYMHMYIYIFYNNNNNIIIKYKSREDGGLMGWWDPSYPICFGLLDFLHLQSPLYTN